MSRRGPTYDYDYDQYGNKIRQYILIKGEIGSFKKPPIWRQVSSFEPERGIDPERLRICRGDVTAGFTISLEVA